MSSPQANFHYHYKILLQLLNHLGISFPCVQKNSQIKRLTASSSQQQFSFLCTQCFPSRKVETLHVELVLGSRPNDCFWKSQKDHYKNPLYWNLLDCSLSLQQFNFLMSFQTLAFFPLKWPLETPMSLKLSQPWKSP